MGDAPRAAPAAPAVSVAEKQQQQQQQQQQLSSRSRSSSCCCRRSPMPAGFKNRSVPILIARCFVMLNENKKRRLFLINILRQYIVSGGLTAAYSGLQRLRIPSRTGGGCRIPGGGALGAAGLLPYRCFWASRTVVLLLRGSSTNYCLHVFLFFCLQRVWQESPHLPTAACAQWLCSSCVWQLKNKNRSYCCCTRYSAPRQRHTSRDLNCCSSRCTPRTSK